MFEALRSILAFAVVLGVLVFFHELGHYAAARWRGVAVEAFSVGFGPALLSWQAKSGTVWKLSALPLGGYVKMRGWGEQSAEHPEPGSFTAASLGSKAIIIAAGPTANLLLAFLLFLGLFLVVGQTVVQPVVSKVIAGGAAAKAGLQAGDRILSAGGAAVLSFEDLQRVVTAHPDQPLALGIRRGPQQLQQTVTVGGRLADGRRIGVLGIEGDAVTTARLGPVAAGRAAAVTTWVLIRDTAHGLWNLVAHQRGASQLGGPLRIAQLSGQVAALGLASLVSFMAMISVNLGLINLVPIPILDGGHLLFYAGEAIYGRPIPLRAQEAGLRFGFALLVGLFLFTTVNDLTRLGVLHWVARLFG